MSHDLQEQQAGDSSTIQRESSFMTKSIRDQVGEETTIPRVRKFNWRGRHVTGVLLDFSSLPCS